MWAETQSEWFSHALMQDCCTSMNAWSHSERWPGAQYKDESIAAMILWQALGGRADTYNFESFYSEGPHTVIPESNPISYTGLVYCALR